MKRYAILFLSCLLLSGCSEILSFGVGFGAGYFTGQYFTKQEMQQAAQAKAKRDAAQKAQKMQKGGLMPPAMNMGAMPSHAPMNYPPMQAQQSMPPVPMMQHTPPHQGYYMPQAMTSPNVQAMPQGQMQQNNPSVNAQLQPQAYYQPYQMTPPMQNGATQHSIMPPQGAMMHGQGQGGQMPAYAPYPSSPTVNTYVNMPPQQGYPQAIAK